MYSQFIYFLVVLALYTLQHPGKKPPYSGNLTFALNLLLYIGFGFFTLWSFRKLKKNNFEEVGGYIPSKNYRLIESRLNILSLMCVAIQIYILDVKFYLDQIPLPDSFITFSGVIALTLFGIYQIIIWANGYRYQNFLGQSGISRNQYIRANIGFNSGILAPWFLISLLLDLIQYTLSKNSLPIANSDLGSLVIILVLLIIFSCYGPALIVRLWNCHPLPDGPHRANILEFCRDNGFRFKEILLWPLFFGKVLIAGVIGILPNWRYLLITSSFLEVLTPEETRGVVAHEMGHVKRFHMLLYLIFLICYGILVYALWDPVFLLSLRFETVAKFLFEGSGNANVISIMYSLPLVLFLIFYFRYVFGFFLRNCERQADLFALELMGKADPLVSALEKIGMLSGNIRDLPSWHHFSIKQRVDYLRRCENSSYFIRKHNRKLYGAILIFLVSVGIVFGGGMAFKGSSFEKKLKTDIELKWLQKEQSKYSLNNAEFSLAVGSIMLERKRWDLAEKFLLEALEKEPGNPDVLNNLAWLYVTATEKDFFHPKTGLKLAKQAARIKRLPYILDTLAEAYFANGNVNEAIATIKQALKLNPTNRAYYIKQLNKFKKDLAGKSGND